jgi:hypothetical protein
MGLLSPFYNWGDSGPEVLAVRKWREGQSLHLHEVPDARTVLSDGKRAMSYVAEVMATQLKPWLTDKRTFMVSERHK